MHSCEGFAAGCIVTGPSSNSLVRVLVRGHPRWRKATRGQVSVRSSKILIQNLLGLRADG